MQVYAFTKGNGSTPSSRQRWFILKEFLQRLDPGGSYTEPFPDCLAFWGIPLIRRLYLGVRVFLFVLTREKNSIFFLQRPIYSKYLLAPLILGLILKKHKVVLDVDDAIYTHSYRKTRILAWLADIVLVGNHQLLEWFKKYNQRTYLIPTSLDIDLYKKISDASKNNPGKFVIGWVGSGKAHEENLKLLQGPLRNLAQRYNIAFKIIGAQNCESIHKFWENAANGFEVEIVDELDWSNPHLVPEQIAQFTIGVMPLKDTPFNRGKSSFKALEYMACGKPVVISGVGENNYLIVNGVNGFISNTEQEWENCISRLLDDPGLRLSIAEEGRQTVARDYSYQANAQKVNMLLRSL